MIRYTIAMSMIIAFILAVFLADVLIFLSDIALEIVEDIGCMLPDRGWYDGGTWREKP